MTLSLEGKAPKFPFLPPMVSPLCSYYSHSSTPQQANPMGGPALGAYGGHRRLLLLLLHRNACCGARSHNPRGTRFQPRQTPFQEQVGHGIEAAGCTGLADSTGRSIDGVPSALSGTGICIRLDGFLDGFFIRTQGIHCGGDNILRCRSDFGIGGSRRRR